MDVYRLSVTYDDAVSNNFNTFKNKNVIFRYFSCVNVKKISKTTSTFMFGFQFFHKQCQYLVFASFILAEQPPHNIDIINQTLNFNCAFHIYISFF